VNPVHPALVSSATSRHAQLNTDLKRGGGGGGGGDKQEEEEEEEEVEEPF
jgi:hypothetical protein